MMSRLRLTALLLALATLLVYLPVRKFTFVNYDDTDYVTENSFVKNGLNWTDIKWAFTSFHASNWHPLTWISHMIDCQLFGPNAGADHFVNVLFHAANAALVFLLPMRLTSLRSEKENEASARPANSLWPCAFIAALFAWHPLHVESVAWISERKDVLSTFFALLSLLSYAKSAQENCRRSFWFALIFFVLSLMSKPMFVTLPFVMLLLDFWPLKRIASSARNNLRLAIEKWPFFLLTAISCVVTFFAQSQRNNSAVASLQSIPLHYRILNTLISYGDYLLKLIWPSKLAVIYPLLENLSRMIEMAFFALIALGIISWLCWRARRRCPYLLFGWLWFLGTLVPVIGLVQVGGAALADRYTYFPSIGIFLAVAFGACELANHFRFPKIIFPGGSVLILGACIFLTEKQLSYWRNSETLFRHAVAVTKDNSVALINLGVALDVQGRFDEALIYYHRALSIEPQRYQIHNNIANILDKSGHPEASLREYRAAVLLEPQNAALHNAIGEVLAELGRFAEALNELTNAAQLDANSAAPHLEMGKIFLKQNRSAAAMGQFRAALGIEPEDFQALTYVARVLATDEDATVRDGKMAMLLAAKANALTGGQQPLVLDAFGMACAETGDFTDAIALTQRALAIARAAKMRKLEPLEQRLQFYKNHQPWRESFLAAPPKKSPAQ